MNIDKIGLENLPNCHFRRIKVTEMPNELNILGEVVVFDDEDEYSALSKILVGWEDVNEEDGTPISFSKTVLKEFSEDTDFVAAVLAAFRKFYANAQVGN